MLRRRSARRPQNPVLSPKRTHSRRDSAQSNASTLEPSKKKKFFTTNSTLESTKNPFAYIEECPTIHLTTQQMQGNLLQLLQDLQKEHQQFGAVKLVSSPEWEPPFTFKYLNSLITTRSQTLQELALGKPFQQNIESHTLVSYKTMAKKFESQYENVTKTDGTPFQQSEFEFWSLVTNPKYSEQKVEVEYAADIPTSKYCSGFPISKQRASVDDNFSYHDSLFNLNNTYKDSESLLQVCEESKAKISGITQPWVYIGMKFASFCWHVQDLYMNSLNYNHKGSTKTWYVVPESDKEKMDEYIMTKCNHLSKGKKDFLHRMTLMINPLDLKKHGIKVHKINQDRKSYVVTFPKAYHCGFSQGYNIGQAVNYGILETLPYMLRAVEEYKLLNGKKTSVFPMEWIVNENFHNLKNSKRNTDWRKEIGKEYQKCLEKELVDIKAILKKKVINSYCYLDNNREKYYRNPCSECQQYLYFSMLRCKGCRKVYCLTHQVDCCHDDLELVLRKPSKERIPLIKCLEGVPFL